MIFAERVEKMACSLPPFHSSRSSSRNLVSRLAAARMRNLQYDCFLWNCLDRSCVFAAAVLQGLSAQLEFIAMQMISPFSQMV
jgi:hypothetical protein